MNMENFELQENNIERIAKDIFERWNNALQTGRKEEVAKLYTENNAFLPTLSGDFKRGIQGAEEYFKHFLEKNPVGKIIEEDIQGNDDFIIHSGLYDFEVDDSAEGRTNVEARFTFVYKKDENGEWKIAHHHSSLKPVNL
jgi:uncharacterized protein (TIGR02246 family)